jgi:hypothetical protein
MYNRKRRSMMDMDTARSFFMWCTIMNAILLVLAFLVSAYAGDWVYRMHSKWFPIPRETFNVVVYSFIGLLKVFVLMFNLVPYLALLILG